MSETTESKTGVQPATTETRSTGRDTTSTSGSRSSSEQSGSKRGKKVYDNASGPAKSPNSSANPLGPVTKIKDGRGGDDTKVYPGMTIGYSQGPGRENYDEGQYANDSVNADYERRAREGVQLPD